MDSPSRTIRGVEVIELQVSCLDADTADEVRKDLADYLQGGKKVVLDLNRVQFVDSSGLRTLFFFLRTLNASGGDLKVCRVSSDVSHAFSVIGVPNIIDVCETVDDAVDAFPQ